MALIKVNNRGQSDNLGRRNLIINGAMQVWQRGTSHANTTAVAYYADRWKHQNRQSSQTDIVLVENQDIGDGVMNVYKITVDTPPTDTNLLVNQFIENGSFTVLDKDITISWYARQSTGSGVTTSANVEVDSGVDYTGTGTNNNLTSSWQRFTQTFSVSGYTASDVSDSSLRLQIFFKGVSSLDVVEFTGVQLEVGDTATPFEHRSVAEELTLCQRYYVNYGLGSNAPSVVALGRDAQYGAIRGTQVSFPVTMRANPTVVIQSSSANSMDRYGRGQETCYPQAEGITTFGFDTIRSRNSNGSDRTWTDSGLYMNRAGYSAEAEL